MSILQIEKHPYHYRLMLYFVFPLVGLSGLWLLFNALFDILNNESDTVTYSAMLAGVLLIVTAVYYGFRYIKNVPAVEYDPEQGMIFIGQQSASIQEIQHIGYFYRMKPGNWSLFSNQMGMKILMNSNDEIVLLDDYYKNLHELKLLLSRHLSGRKPITPEITKVNIRDLKEQKVKWIKNSLFKGRPVKYLFFILIMLVFTGFQYLLTGPGLLTLAFLCMTLIGFISLSRQTFYFGFSPTCFTVKNYLSRAHSEAWLLKDIQKAFIYQKEDVAQLTLVFKNFSYKNYSSIVLDEQLVERLQKYFKEVGIDGVEKF